MAKSGRQVLGSFAFRFGFNYRKIMKREKPSNQDPWSLVIVCILAACFFYYLQVPYTALFFATIALFRACFLLILQGVDNGKK
jgi:hypothetical protein